MPARGGSPSGHHADTLFFSRRLVMEGDTALGLELRNALDALGALVPFQAGR